MQENHPAPAQEPKPKKSDLLSEVFEYAESLGVMFAAMLLIFTFLCRPATVSGESMEPTLHNGERLLISRLFYEPKPGDIVVMAPTADKAEGKNLIKRVIAVGGQKVDIDYQEGIVYVDGEALDESYILEPTYLDEGTALPLTVPEGELFIMGDNRNNSRDSRSVDVGCVKEDEVVGRCLLRFFPLDRFGKISDTGRVVFE